MATRIEGAGFRPAAWEWTCHFCKQPCFLFDKDFDGPNGAEFRFQRDSDVCFSCARIVCLNCGYRRKEHDESQCLYNSTRFETYDMRWRCTQIDSDT